DLPRRERADARAARTELVMPGENVLAHTAPPLWRDAAPARGRGPPLGLSAVLALRLALALAPILPTALSIGLLLGAVPASAGSPNRYQEYDQGAYLPKCAGSQRGHHRLATSARLVWRSQLRCRHGYRLDWCRRVGGQDSEHRQPAIAGTGPAHLFQLRRHHDRSVGRHGDDDRGR